MNPRDTIARARYGQACDGGYEIVGTAAASAILQDLTAAGYRIVGPADMEAVEAGWVLVPVAALKWLNGEGPDGNGHGFGDAPDDNGRGAFWWRKKFTDMLPAAHKPAALTQEPKPAEGEK